MLTTNKEEQKQYNVKEFATESIFNRHQFTSKPNDFLDGKNSTEIYYSHFDHSNYIIQYYDEHFDEEGKHTLSNYDGEISVSEIVIDIDNSDLEKSQEDANTIINRLEKVYGVSEHYFGINFSGSKGFHIRIPSSLFGDFEPSNSLGNLIKKICLELSKGVKIDVSIYKTISLIRVPNTINQKSGLYAIPLTFVDVSNLSIDRIKKMAENHREGNDYWSKAQPVPKLVELKENILASKSSNDTTIDDIEDEKIPLAEAVKPQKSGDRHWNLITAVGHFIDKGFSNEVIHILAQALNSKDKPPKNESYIREQVDKLIRSSKHIEGPFWSIRRGSRVEIKNQKYIDFLVNNGFVKVFYDKTHIYVHIKNNIAEEVVVTQIRDHVNNYIRNITGESEKYREVISDKLLDGYNKYFNEKFLDAIETENLDLKMDDRHNAHLYYKNNIVKLTKDGNPQIIPYSALDKPIWKEQIINREFQIISDKQTKSEYEQFIWNVSGQKGDRFQSMCSAIGYLLHRYKNKSEAKAIVLMDEKISELDDPNGRSGKSMFGKALSYIRNSVRIDGKNFKFRDQFTFQQIKMNTEIAEFNDVKKNFNFENLFSVVTDDINVEYKRITTYSIPFETSAKFLISTNYTIKGNGGSYKDRMFELEFSDHYNESHKPIDEFGHLFFDDWDTEEWNRFDNFMLKCLQLYINKGLIEYKFVNAETRKILDQTSKEFMEFIESNLELDKEYEKKKLYNSFMGFIGFHPLIYEKSDVTQTSFTNWVKIFAQYKGYKYTVKRSNGVDYFTISAK